MARQRCATRHLNALAAWDLFGAADLVLAITLGVKVARAETRRSGISA
jgi:hypothetical protein